jgi:hypothetical protein
MSKEQYIVEQKCKDQDGLYYFKYTRFNEKQTFEHYIMNTDVNSIGEYSFYRAQPIHVKKAVVITLQDSPTLRGQQ